MNKKKFKNVLVVQGGTSGERKISLETGKACIKALKNKGYKVLIFDPKIKNSIDESLNKIIANPNLYQIQKNSIEKAEKNSIENHIEKILIYYNSVLSK